MPRVSLMEDIMFVLISTVLFGFLGFAWSKKDWWNLVIKLVSISMFFWGFFSSLLHLGYIIQL